MTRLFNLMNAPLEELADTVLDIHAPMPVRHKAWNALNSRLPELNGAAWVRKSQTDMILINTAIALDMSDETFQSTSQAS